MDTFVARQPILDRDQALYGYELRFRGGTEDVLRDWGRESASPRVAGGTAPLVGIDPLTGGNKAFVNITRDVLVQQLFSTLPSERVVIELARNIEPDAEVLAACWALKGSGYLLALDDFVHRPSLESLVELADFLKVDFLRSRTQERRKLAERYRSRIHLLAENVETIKDAQDGLDLGFEYYQGFFFCEPELISRRDIPGFKLNYLRFMQEISHPALDFDRLAEILRREVSLSVKLLRLLRSAAFGYGGQVSSVKQALIALGERAIKKWATMTAFCDMGEDRPRELVVLSLVRARMCELLASHLGLGRYREDLFLVGMLSLLDALVGRPMTELIDEMAVSDDIRAALFDDDSLLGNVRCLAVAQERGNWEGISSLSLDLGISERFIPTLYTQAIVWAREVFQA